MTLPANTTLIFDPANLRVDARIIKLTAEVNDLGMGPHWWSDPSLILDAANQSIDSHWNWFDTPELHGINLACERIAITITGLDIQGAMIISIDPVKSNLAANQQCLFVDQICTAPRNRPSLRRDQRKWYKGVGPQLLIWGSKLSAELGYAGKLWLLASPDGEPAYLRLGFVFLNLDPVIYDGIQYKPMELPLEAASALLRSE